MIDVLAGNLSRLHVGTRKVLAACFRRPELYGVISKALRAFLLSRAATLAPAVADKTCSVLANLLYWRESGHALGPERFRQLVEKADSLVRRGETVEFGSIPGS